MINMTTLEVEKHAVTLSDLNVGKIVFNEEHEHICQVDATEL